MENKLVPKKVENKEIKENERKDRKKDASQKGWSFGTEARKKFKFRLKKKEELLSRDKQREEKFIITYFLTKRPIKTITGDRI